MARDSKGITQFYLPLTHEPYLPLLPSCRASLPFWLVLIAPTHGGMAKLSWPGDWLYTEIDFPHRELNLDMVTHPSTKRAQCTLTSLIKTNSLTTMPNRQPSNHPSYWMVATHIWPGLLGGIFLTSTLLSNRTNAGVPHINCTDSDWLSVTCKLPTMFTFSRQCHTHVYKHWTSKNQLHTLTTYLVNVWHQF